MRDYKFVLSKFKNKELVLNINNIYESVKAISFIVNYNKEIAYDTIDIIYLKKDSNGSYENTEYSVSYKFADVIKRKIENYLRDYNN
jgi:hypothetical protein